MLPGATPMEAMRWLGLNGPAVEGVEEIRACLQQMMDDAMTALDGRSNTRISSFVIAQRWLCSSPSQYSSSTVSLSSTSC